MNDTDNFTPTIVRTYPRQGDLTPGQIEWCRKTIPHFSEAADDVLVAHADAKRLSLKARGQ